MLSQMSLYEGGRRRFDTHRESILNTEQRDLKVLALKTEVMWAQTKESHSHQNLEETRNGFPIGASGGSMALLHLDFNPMILILDL